jgi:hypothetical protein
MEAGAEVLCPQAKKHQGLLAVIRYRRKAWSRFSLRTLRRADTLISNF